LVEYCIIQQVQVDLHDVIAYVFVEVSSAIVLVQLLESHIPMISSMNGCRCDVKLRLFMEVGGWKGMFWEPSTSSVFGKFWFYPVRSQYFFTVLLPSNFYCMRAFLVLSA